MPSPIGHALAGIAAGWLIDPPDTRPNDRNLRGTLTRAAIFALAAMAPDLDLLVGAHSGPTHGLGAAVIVGAVVWVWSRRRDGSRTAPAAVAAAYASHTLL